MRGSTAYAVTLLAQRGATLVLLPFLLQVVTPTQYGQVAVLTSLAALASAALSLGLEGAVVRTYFQLGDDPAERSRFLGTVGTVLFVVPAAACGIGAAALLTLNPTYVPVSSVLFALAGAAVAVPAVLPLSVLRLEERLRDYVIVSFASTSTSVVLLLFLVIGMELGVNGWLAAILVSNTVLLAGGFAATKDSYARTISRRHLAAAIAFGLPLVPHLIAHWGLNLSDRAILAGSVSADQIGIYNLGYQLAMPVGLLAAAVNQAVKPLVSRAAAPGGSAAGLSQIMTMQIWASAFFGMVAAVLGPVVVDVAMPTSYADAARIVGLVALGYVLYGWYVIPMNALSISRGDTRWLWAPSGLAAVINICLNLLLVPAWGITAAAINTGVAYAALLVATAALARQSRAMAASIEIIPVVAGLAFIGVAGLIASFAGTTGVVGVAIRGAVVAAVGLALIWSLAREPSSSRVWSGPQE